jgi:hypothetical protein
MTADPKMSKSVLNIKLECRLIDISLDVCPRVRWSPVLSIFALLVTRRNWQRHLAKLKATQTPCHKLGRMLAHSTEMLEVHVQFPMCMIVENRRLERNLE